MQLHVSYLLMTSPHSPAATRWDGRLWAVLIVLCGVLFLDGLDVSMVGVALPSIQADLAKHPDTARHSAIELMGMLAFAGHLSTEQQVREFLDGIR